MSRKQRNDKMETEMKSQRQEGETMETNYTIDGNVTVIESSISDLSISTADQNEQGYLLADGSHRCLKHGISSDGSHVIYMHTGGYDLPVYDDIDSATNWCADMGDRPKDLATRIKIGSDRLIEAVQNLEARYKGNETALESLAWYRDKAQEVLTHNDIEANS